MDQFDHERMEVYRRARQANREIRGILEEMPRGHAESKDNLRRAAKSVTRNISEGSGKWQVPDKVKFYHIARGSANESASSLDELVDFGVTTEERIVEAKRILMEVVAMLTALIRSIEKRQGRS
jgi:four helix bundle protein